MWTGRMMTRLWTLRTQKERSQWATPIPTQQQLRLPTTKPPELIVLPDGRVSQLLSTSSCLSALPNNFFKQYQIFINRSVVSNSTPLLYSTPFIHVLVHSATEHSDPSRGRVRQPVTCQKWKTIIGQQKNMQSHL